MAKTEQSGGARARRVLCASAFALACAAAAALPQTTGATVGAGAAAGAGAFVRAGATAGAVEAFTSRANRRAQGGERVDIRLRSFVPGASGQLTIEAGAGGGRVRLTALNLPPPESQSRGATTYVVWANREGSVRRLGELRRDERGNGGLAFDHPAPFDRYTVIVTAERLAEAERPAGAPVLSTRANEAAALFPPEPAATPDAPTTTPEATSSTATAPADTTTAPAETKPAPAEPATAAPSNPTAPTSTGAPTPPLSASDASGPTPASPRPARRTRARRIAGDFYTEVDDALDAQGGGRSLVLDGEGVSPRAGGRALVAERTGNAYVVARFSDVPMPDVVGASAYALWAIVPDGRIVYMGSLPADATLNRADIYVRVSGFDSSDFNLFVTAERRRPAQSPSDSRALSTRQPRYVVK